MELGSLTTPGAPPGISSRVREPPTEEEEGDEGDDENDDKDGVWGCADVFELLLLEDFLSFCLWNTCGCMYNAGHDRTSKASSPALGPFFLVLFLPRLVGTGAGLSAPRERARNDRN